MPKQFLDILGTGKSLIRQTFERFSDICPVENVFVVTNKAYKDLVLEHIPELSESQVLLEPMMRNTAPCIAYATYKIAGLNPEANIVVAPSDHLILDVAQFNEIINLAIKETNETDALVTLGIKPSRPDTGYGYICFEDKKADDTRVKNVLQFTEKPALDKAKEFLSAGNYYWNSGIFIWSLRNIKRNFEEHLPDMAELFAAGADKFNSPEEQAFIDERFGDCDNISIDYGIMEPAKQVSVVLSDFGWSDLGTYGSLATHLEADADGNSNPRENVRYYEAKNNVVIAPEDHFAVIQGLEGHIVVQTEKALLICRKDDEQMIKTFVNDLKNHGPKEQV
jgi:mannose-1-phosphate guanylyltransferase